MKAEVVCLAIVALLVIGNFGIALVNEQNTDGIIAAHIETNAGGTTYYVAKDGNDSNPGTEDQPWLTIQKAAETLVAGDTVYIKEGTYIERVIPLNSGSSDNYITYQNYPGHEVIIESPNTWEYDYCIFLPEDMSLHYLRFIGLKLKKANWANFCAAASDSYPKSNIILENMSSNSSFLGIYFWNGVTHSEIKNCEIHYNQFGIELNELNRNILIDSNHVSHSQIVRSDLEPYWSHNIIITTYDGSPGNENTEITITNNNVHHSLIQGILVWHGKNILVKGNHCHHNGATGIQIEAAAGMVTDPITKNIVVENNICEYNSQKSDFETGIWIDDTDNCLVQNNIMRHNNIGLTITGSRQVIARNNLIYENNESYVGVNVTLMAVYIDGGGRAGYDNIVVHNTLYNNAHMEDQRGGVSIGAYSYTAYRISRVVIKDNILSETAGRDLWIKHLTHSLDYNNYYDTEELIINWQGDDKTWAEYLSASGQDSHSITSNPHFVNAVNKDFHLQSNSPCIDKGGFLTKTTNSGSGKILKVEDARYFTDGYGVIEGDLIQIGSNDPVRITNIDYDNNVITIDQDMSWSNGDGVSYPYSGSAPDIGAYEYQGNDDYNLDCNGILSWPNVQPGSVVNGSFTVENVGDPGLEIDWCITEWPSWGTWTFTPISGDNLSPEDGPITVEVSVVAPDEHNKGFTGGIKIVNKDNINDFCMVPVSLATPKNKQMISTLFIQFLEIVIERFPMLEWLLKLPSL